MVTDQIDGMKHGKYRELLVTKDRRRLEGNPGFGMRLHSGMRDASGHAHPGELSFYIGFHKAEINRQKGIVMVQSERSERQSGSVSE